MKMPGRGLVIATGLSTSVTRIGSSICASSTPPGRLDERHASASRSRRNRDATSPASRAGRRIPRRRIRCPRVMGPWVVNRQSASLTTFSTEPSCVFQADLKQQLGEPIGRHRHGDVSSGGEITAVAQNDSDRVVSRMNVAGHVERDVESATVVSGQGRVHELVADQLAVQVKVEEAEAANVGRRPPDFVRRP